MPTYVVGAITPPAVPASTVAFTNNFGMACLVTVQGTVSVVAVNGVSLVLLGSVFVVPQGATIALTYVTPPTWTWFGLG